MSLLSFKFREFGSVTALSVLEAANSGVKKLDAHPSRGPYLHASCLSMPTDAPRLAELGSSELSFMLSPFDLKRLDSYSNNQLDYHVIMDLLPTVGQLYFEKRLGPEVRLSAVQSSILLALGMQRKSIEEIEVRPCEIFSRPLPLVSPR